MAQVGFKVSTENQDNLGNLLAVAKINVVKQLAGLKSWTFDGPEYHYGFNEYWIDVPDSEVRRTLQDIQEYGIIPDIVRFTADTLADPAIAITTFHCEYSWNPHPEG